MCRKALQGIADAAEGLDDLLHISATGEVLRMRDAYGTRFGEVAGFSYGDTPVVCLFDIDGSESVRLLSPVSSTTLTRLSLPGARRSGVGGRGDAATGRWACGPAVPDRTRDRRPSHRR
ncbi:hypothetical protein JCM33774_70990 [Actinophytocola sp. KF-1]